MEVIGCNVIIEVVICYFDGLVVVVECIVLIDDMGRVFNIDVNSILDEVVVFNLGIVDFFE